MEITLATLGDRIKYARKKKGYFQDALGELLGMKNSTISKYESNTNKPAADVLADIAKTLDVAPGLLITGASEDPWIDEMIALLQQGHDARDRRLVKGQVELILQTEVETCRVEVG